MPPRKPREDLELHPSAYDDPDRQPVKPVTGSYPGGKPQETEEPS